MNADSKQKRYRKLTIREYIVGFCATVFFWIAFSVYFTTADYPEDVFRAKRVTGYVDKITCEVVRKRATYTEYTVYGSEGEIIGNIRPYYLKEKECRQFSTSEVKGKSYDIYRVGLSVHSAVIGDIHLLDFKRLKEANSVMVIPGFFISSAYTIFFIYKIKRGMVIKEKRS